ncbi:hypothetical protein ACNOYE_15395 [Nannocystaceae bacterium ST9]
MKPWKRIALGLVVGVLVLIFVIFVIGLSLPREHESVRSADYPVALEQVWTRLAAVEDYPSRRGGWSSTWSRVAAPSAVGGSTSSSRGMRGRG